MQNYEVVKNVGEDVEKNVSRNGFMLLVSNMRIIVNILNYFMFF